MDALKLSYVEFATGIQKHIGKPWGTFLPDAVLSVVFLLDLDHDGMISWKDFFGFGVMAEVAMRHSPATEKKTSAEFLATRKQIERSRYLGNSCDRLAFQKMEDVASSLKKARSGQQFLALVEFTALKAGGAHLVNQDELDDLITALNEMNDAHGASPVSSPSSSSLPTSLTDDEASPSSSPLSEQNTEFSFCEDKNTEIPSKFMDMSSILNSTIVHQTRSVDTSIFKQGTHAVKQSARTVRKNAYCEKSCKWKSHYVTSPKTDRFVTEQEIRMAKRVNPVFFG